MDPEVAGSKPVTHPNFRSMTILALQPSRVAAGLRSGSLSEATKARLVLTAFVCFYFATAQGLVRRSMR